MRKPAFYCCQLEGALQAPLFCFLACLAFSLLPPLISYVFLDFLFLNTLLSAQIPRLNGAMEVPAPLLPALSSLDPARRSWLDSAFDSVLHHSPHLPPPPPPLHMSTAATNSATGGGGAAGGGGSGTKMQPVMPICHLCGLLCPDESKKRSHMQQVRKRIEKARLPSVSFIGIISKIAEASLEVRVHSTNHTGFSSSFFVRTA